MSQRPKLRDQVFAVAQAWKDGRVDEAAVYEAIDAAIEAAAQEGRPMPNRMRLLLALALMPDEAFSWFVLACGPSAMMHGGNAQIWPDGIGGFGGDSRAAIVEVRAAADAYLKEAQS